MQRRECRVSLEAESPAAPAAATAASAAASTASAAAARASALLAAATHHLAHQLEHHLHQRHHALLGALRSAESAAGPAKSLGSAEALRSASDVDVQCHVIGLLIRCLAYDIREKGAFDGEEYVTVM